MRDDPYLSSEHVTIPFHPTYVAVGAREQGTVGRGGATASRSAREGGFDAPEDQRPDLSIVVPVYRSEDCLEPLVDAVKRALGPTGWDYELVLVNDGSPDRSWKVIEALARTNPEIVGINLRRNFGQDNAILTGFRATRGRLVAVMDDDLQHDPADLPFLVAALERQDADVAYADFRCKRQKLWKNVGSWFNGKVAEWVFDKPKGVYLSPYKVIRGDVAKELCQHDGPDPYIDGLLFQVTSRFTQVPVEHHARYAGRSTYSLARSIQVWARVATAFSVKPLRLVTWCGLAFAVLGGLLAAFVVGYRLLYPEEFATSVAGWASLMVGQLLTSAVQMVFLGILGEYAGRSYLTNCRKPQATVREVIHGNKAGSDRGALPLVVERAAGIGT
jgi:undecaprenyl-phosphate 4-deoxy-4-formamido-L-arabinose transferase